MFGSREFLKNNYLYRYAGAKLGLYGNSGNEAIYLAYFVDADHQPLDAAKANYTLVFPRGQLPPAKAFWSLTMYDGKTQYLVANPIKRYLINSTMLNSFTYGSDRSLKIYVRERFSGCGKRIELAAGARWSVPRDTTSIRTRAGSGGWRLEKAADATHALISRCVSQPKQSKNKCMLTASRCVVNLSRRQTGMPEQFLNRAQVRAVDQQVRCEAVPKSVRRYTTSDADAHRPIFDGHLRAS